MSARVKQSARMSIVHTNPTQRLNLPDRYKTVVESALETLRKSKREVNLLRHPDVEVEMSPASMSVFMQRYVDPANRTNSVQDILNGMWQDHLKEIDEVLTGHARLDLQIQTMKMFAVTKAFQDDWDDSATETDEDE